MKIEIEEEELKELVRVVFHSGVRMAGMSAEDIINELNNIIDGVENTQEFSTRS